MSPSPWTYRNSSLICASVRIAAGPWCTLCVSLSVVPCACLFRLGVERVVPPVCAHVYSVVAFVCCCCAALRVLMLRIVYGGPVWCLLSFIGYCVIIVCVLILRWLVLPSLVGIVIARVYGMRCCLLSVVLCLRCACLRCACAVVLCVRAHVCLMRRCLVCVIAQAVVVRFGGVWLCIPHLWQSDASFVLMCCSC